MNLSDPSDDDSSSDESPVPAKRVRVDTYGASSTTSHGSALVESDEEPSETNADYTADNNQVQQNNRHKYSEPNVETTRLSRSSVSETCSSPNDQYDDYQPTFESFNDSESSVRSRTQENDDQLYRKESTTSEEADNTYQTNISKKALKMMGKMGFKHGKGLGKFEHGRTEPVEASTQKGRRGLGLKPSEVGVAPKDFKWTPDEAPPEAKETVTWLPPPPNEPLSGDLLDKWLKKGPKKLNIDDETLFVNPQILQGVLNSKTIFDSLDDDDLRKARFRSNPYETIGSVIFLNRAAVKMANLDSVFDFMFTKPKKADGTSAVDKNEVLYFADVCAGPGGFSEYVLFRRGWMAKGFGFTLKGSNDFKLSDFYAGNPETFNPFYGTAGDGNIFYPANLSSLKDNVLKYTDDKGVHFLMADGGFSVAGQENIQEILSKQLYLCQCLAALMLVRTGGHFVVKLFDVFTMFSVGLLYIMYRCFDKVCIHKPVTSRPANSERYLVCMYKKLSTEAAERHLFSVNSMLWTEKDTDHDITELVPLEIIQEDTAFYDYIYNSNCVLGEKQIKNLLKIAEFSKEKNLKEESQAAMKEQCLKLWCLPDKVRTQPERLQPDYALTNILTSMKKPPPESHNLSSFKTNVLNKPPEYLENLSDLKLFTNVYDWHFMYLSGGKSSALTSDKSNSDLRFFLGCGGKQVYQLENCRWKSVADLQLIMPPKTLIYGEIVKEYKGQGNNQMHSKALHILDALILGGVNISHYTLTERINQCQLFCKALYKPFESTAMPMRCKRLFNMESFASAMNKLEFRKMKRVGRTVTIDVPNRIDDVEMFYTVGSILFIKEIKEPWTAQMSKKNRCKYYFRFGENKKIMSEYHILEEARLDMISGFTGRIMWAWDSAANEIFEGHSHRGISRADVTEYIQNNIEKR